MSALKYVAGKLPLDLGGRHYERGAKLDARDVTMLKPASLRHLLDTGRITLVVDGAAVSPQAAAFGVDTRRAS